jgi:hypothetical protein
LSPGTRGRWKVHRTPITEENSWRAEKVFDVRWATTVAEQALRRLQEECEEHKRPRLFDILSSLFCSIPPALGEELIANYQANLCHSCAHPWLNLNSPDSAGSKFFGT